MAITAGVLTNGASTTDGLAFTTASITPGANRLITISIMARRKAASADIVVVTIIGNGITYTEVNKTVASSAGRCLLYRGMAASPSAGAIVITFDELMETCLWSVTEFDGVDTTGTNGSGAVVQSAVRIEGGVTEGDVTLAAFGDATNNAPFMCDGTRSAPTMTPEAGYTELSDQNTSEDTSLASEWKIGEDTNVTMTSNGAGDHYMVAMEIKDAGAPAAAAGLNLERIERHYPRGHLRGVMRGAVH